MFCSDPKILVHRHAVTDREYFQFVPCGNCYACRCGKRGEIVLRMDAEFKDRRNFSNGRVWAYFFTLTYNDSNLPSIFNEETTKKLTDYYRCLPNSFRRYDYSLLCREDLSNFLHSLFDKFVIDFCNGRVDEHGDVVTEDTNTHCRYFCTGEYGHISHRAHYHGVILFPREVHYFDVLRMISDSWDKGNVDVQSVETKGACNYVAKHQVKDCEGSDFQKKVSPIFSIRSIYEGGLGRSLKDDKVMKNRYLDSLVTHDKSLCYYSVYQDDKEYKIAIPRYLIKEWHPSRFDEDELSFAQELSFDNLKEFVFDNLLNNFELSDKTYEDLHLLKFQFENIIECDLLNRDPLVKNEVTIKKLRSMLTKISAPLKLEDMARNERYVNKCISKKLNKLKNQFTDDFSDNF